MNMRIAIVGGLMASLVGAPVVMAQDKCPIELREAKAKLLAASKTTNAPRSAAGFQGGGSEAPRGSVEAPRSAAGFQGGSSEAPRGSVEAPRSAAGFQGGSSEAPRGNVEAPRSAAGAKSGGSAMLAQARKLIAEAEADCQKGDMTASTQKAKAALEALK